MCLDENGRRLNVGGKKCTHVINGGCVSVGTADNEGLDMLMRSMVVVWMVVMQSKWKKVECREEGDSVLNLSAL